MKGIVNLREMLEPNKRGYNALCLGIPIIVFSFLFLPYILFGENCVITIHDNLDSNIAWYKYVRDNHYLFKFDMPSTVMNGLSTLYFAGSFTLNTIIFYLFPPFTAYTVNFMLFSLVGFFSLYYVQKLIFHNEHRLTLVLTSLMFACLPCFPGFRMDISAIPCAVLLFYYIYRGTRKRLWLLSFFYPFISSFGGTGMFLCGFWLLGFVVISIKQRKIYFGLLYAFLLLCVGTVLCNLRLFYMRLFLDEPLNRDFFTVEPSSFFKSFKIYFMNGYYHATSLQRKIVLPFSCFALLAGLGISFFENSFSFRNVCKKIPGELKALLYCFSLIFCFSAIAALDDAGIMQQIVSVICPPLKGVSFARFFLFSSVVWYILFSAAIIYFYREKIAWMLAVVCIVLQLLTICTYKDYYGDSARSWKKNTVGAHPRNITYREFYAINLFEKIKDDISYVGEPVCAVGYHPSVLMYNGFNCIDGYISVYPHRDMVLWHNLMAPEFTHNEHAGAYFDSWGGRRYVYNEQLDVEPTREKEHEPVFFDVDMSILRNDFHCSYVLSRASLANADECGLQLKGVFDDDTSLYRIFVYGVQ